MKKYLMWIIGIFSILTLVSCTSNKDNGTKEPEETETPGGKTETPGGNTETPGGNTETPGGNTETNTGTTDSNPDIAEGTITKQGKVGIDAVSGTYEGAFLDWNEVGTAVDYSVYYKLTSENDSKYVAVDEELVRDTRVDIVGLKGNTEYDIRIAPIYSSGETLADATIAKVKTIKYDRSGYAHFNYSEGVGAYNDDGTLKDDAIVIYVTNDNKDKITVAGSNCKPGLGWLLNNNMYGAPGKDSDGKSNDKDNDPNTNWYDTGIAKITNTNPVAIRLIGKIETPAGTTIYNSLENGGSVGDNGHMARMKNAKNVTIEGVGDGATIDGWGIHFMRGTASNGVDGGYSFEARNITFDKYPEDAIGMEGIQSGSTLTAPVSRCWIHDSTFMPGYCAKPAESDKAEGDGSCDFKRGEYFTLSYCKFFGAHKTNLVGSSDSSLQYNMTMHHNYWQDCGSRIPLTRQANLHMYNNFFEITDKCTNEISYAQNTRANAYIYSEHNYFQACKKPSDVASGAIKSFGDIKYSCFEADGATVVNSRDTKVSSGNKYENFDTNNGVFYYDSTAKKSAVERLTTAEKAKAECIALSGANKKAINYDDAKIYSTAPTVLSESVKVTTTTKISKGTPLSIFTISTEATFTMTSAGKVDAVLVDINGKMMLKGTGNVDLQPGTYVIEAAQARGASKGTSQAKDASISSYSIDFDRTAAIEARIASVNAAIAKIPSVITLNDDCMELILSARKAFDSLKDDEKSSVNETLIINAETSYITLAKANVELLISQIGNVNMNSGTKILAARDAYDDLISFSKSVVVSNYATLQSAETSFESFAIQSVINKITLIGTVSITSEVAIEAARTEYSNLTDAQKAEVTNYSILQDAEESLRVLKVIAEVNALIVNVNLSNLASLENVITKYNALSTVEKAEVTDITKLSQINVAYTIKLIEAIETVVATSSLSKIVAAEKQYTSLTTIEQGNVTNYSVLTAAREALNILLSQAMSIDFNKGETNASFIVGGSSTTNYNATVGGVTYSKGLKIDGKGIITFTTIGTKTLYIICNEKTLLIDEKSYTPVNNVIEITITEGTHTVKKGSGEGCIFYVLVS